MKVNLPDHLLRRFRHDAERDHFLVERLTRTLDADGSGDAEWHALANLLTDRYQPSADGDLYNTCFIGDGVEDEEHPSGACVSEHGTADGLFARRVAVHVARLLAADFAEHYATADLDPDDLVEDLTGDEALLRLAQSRPWYLARRFVALTRCADASLLYLGVTHLFRVSDDDLTDAEDEDFRFNLDDRDDDRLDEVVIDLSDFRAALYERVRLRLALSGEKE